MPLSKPTPRALSHTRKLELKAYERKDGLWDIEGRLVVAATEAVDEFTCP